MSDELILTQGIAEARKAKLKASERRESILREALERIASLSLSAEERDNEVNWPMSYDYLVKIARDALLSAEKEEEFSEEDKYVYDDAPPAPKPEVRSCETSIKYVDLWHCPRCNGATRTFRHLYARVWCHDCGFVLREEGDQTVQHRTPAAPEAKE